jgi:drug/metabolite transporter (DMT)-like permease
MPSTTPVKPASRASIAIAFAIVYVVWGSTYLAIRYAIETLPPFLMAGARFIVAGLIVYAWVAWREGAPRPTAAEWKQSAIVGAFLLLGGNGAVVWAEQRVPSGIAALLVATLALWMVGLEWARPNGTRPTLPVIGGVLLGLVGVGILVGPQQLVGGDAVDPMGAIALIAASLSWAIGSLASRSPRMPRSVMLGAATQMLAGGTMLLVAGALRGEATNIRWEAMSAESIAAFAYLVVFGSLVGFTAYIWLLGHVSAASASTYAYVNPVVAVLLGWAIAGEPVGGRTLAAGAVIVLAVALITVGRTRSQPAARASEEDGALLCEP